MAYMAEDIHGPATVTDHAHQLGPNLKGGYRMDTTTSPDGRQKHSRAKFDKERRIEVQELSEFIDLYSAGVQVVMAQKRINGYKTSYDLQNTGVVVEASHFPESGHTVTFQVFQGYPREELENENALKLNPHPPVVLLDNDREDIPVKVETYMRNMLPEYITHEPSPYVRTTLQIADLIAKETNDELLKRSLELSPQPEIEDYWIKDDSQSEAYSNICMQLTAAAERKASIASKNLLNGIQRSLQDGKTRLGFPMFLTVMLFLNCLEKTTWAFKAWDQENLRPKWPLERPPGSYTHQGHGLTELLRMLLLIRHVLPKTIQSDLDVPIVAEGEGYDVKKYFQDLNVTPRYLRMRYHDNNFQPTDSRSLEFLFCAQLLLHAPPPHAELPPMPRGALQTNQQHPQQEIRQETQKEAPQDVSHVATTQEMTEATSQEITQDA
ncbi:hypothetical protein NPX13_g9490 [Xylaria arbuscula]|uniref:Uncharacterized protein n=1 Tax=Xylaria arbuscula TaxID=114810 RepID=A0A9W8N6M2_9PEZI|nr:hypothetical protein NPX13_g9490 [Xylaria arbuscula]